MKIDNVEIAAGDVITWRKNGRVTKSRVIGINEGSGWPVLVRRMGVIGVWPTVIVSVNGQKLKSNAVKRNRK